MIICHKCDFQVSNKMRYAVSSNSCPSCGAVLLNKIEVQKISALESMVSKEDFSKSLEDSMISDISFFIYFHIIKEFSESAGTGDSSKIEPSLDEDLEDDAIETDDDSENMDLKSIRDEVESEVLSDESTSFLIDEEDDDNKISRLKDMAKKQKLSSKSQLRVKRISR